MEKKVSGIAEKEDAGIRLEHFLRRRMHLTKNEISRAKFFREGICVNGDRRKVSTCLESGDLVEVLLETGEEVSEKLQAFPGSLSVLYEDQDVIVVDKPSGLAVHPSGQDDIDTLANRLAAYLREKKEDSVIRIMGRLDKGTSGVVLAVKNRGAAVRLERQRECGQLCKSYLAIVEGVPRPEQGRIDSPLGQEPGEKSQMCVDPEGKRAVTRYTLLKTIHVARRGMPCEMPPEGESGETDKSCALVRLELETGRTHQIRVHMASIGHPLLGDSRYGNGTIPGMERTALHAWRLHFLQPFTGEELQVEASVPVDMQVLLL